MQLTKADQVACRGIDRAPPGMVEIVEGDWAAFQVVSLSRIGFQVGSDTQRRTCHSEGIENFPLQEGAERFAGCPLDDVVDEAETEVGIDIAFTGQADQVSVTEDG